MRETVATVASHSRCVGSAAGPRRRTGDAGHAGCALLPCPDESSANHYLSIPADIEPGEAGVEVSARNAAFIAESSPTIRR